MIRFLTFLRVAMTLYFKSIREDRPQIGVMIRSSNVEVPTVAFFIATDRNAWRVVDAARDIGLLDESESLA